MRTLRRRWVLPAAAIIGATSVLLAGCSAPDGDESTGGGDDAVTVRIAADVPTLDPGGVSPGIDAAMIMDLVYNGLVRYDAETNEILPDLATGWETSEDGLSWTFQLEEGVQWHDGYGEFTAEDVKFSIDRVLDPDQGSVYRQEYAEVASVDVVDDYTVRINLSSPNPSFLYKVASNRQGHIVSKAAVEELGDAATMNPIGTGAYAFESWIPGEGVELTAFPEYFRGEPTLSGLEFVVIPEESAAEIALSTGEIDVFFQASSPQVLDQIAELDDVHIVERNALQVCQLVLNNTVGPLTDVRVRQAMAHAMNRESLVDDLLSGRGTIANTMLNPEHPEYTEDGIEVYEYDPELAQGLLAEAGYPDGFEFEWTTLAAFPFDAFPVALAQDLEAVGIRTSISNLDRATFTDTRAAGNVAAVTACTSHQSALSQLNQIFHSDAFPPGQNLARYTGVDELLNAAQVEFDDDARAGLIQDAAAQATVDLPNIPLYYMRNYMPVTDRLEGLGLTARGTLVLDDAHWVD
jgi:peptide/nickel transport system substrate-binding protein